METLIIDNNEVIIRLILAMFLGSLLGVERLMAGKIAGMRTYSLVSIGSATFVIVAQIVAGRYVDILSPDPLRVVGNIVTGIGFIGAGLIIFRNSKVRGLTTAAGLWVVASIGISVGFGLYTIAIITTLLALFVFVGLWFLKIKITQFSHNSFPHMIDGDDEV